jgi:hypothetical protein
VRDITARRGGSRVFIFVVVPFKPYQSIERRASRVMFPDSNTLSRACDTLLITLAHAFARALLLARVHPPQERIVKRAA